ncbi:hypothetical protein [Ferruginivarius sediminum]|uniref:ABC-type transport auxiliary lipoprotein component domain-containing protein n=1 Tax=Ferruginivarius sediminum TaxID=2661937 RepID=A0A369TB05_9PROT|nr:hypothetical protein [Ferruginivarius sediminum]RDD61555.1 hypothetical protein DRB17_12735 [Ferruginivarius sediminum]
MPAMPRLMLASMTIAVAALLGACESTPPQQSFAKLTYTHLEPIRLDVADIAIEQAYDPPMEPPYVEHTMPVSPAEAARSWAMDRLRAVGSEGRATFIIENAPVREIDLETKEGLAGLFTSEPAQRYEATLQIRMTIERPDGTGSLSVKAERATSVQEDATVNEREKTWYGLVERLMNDVNARLEKTLSRDWNKYVRGGPPA